MNDFVSHTGIDWKGNVGVVQYGSDQNMICMFYNKAVHNPAKSAAAGRPVFEDQVYVRIHPPGERLNIIDRPANASDKKRWPLQWMQFSEQREQIPEGTPIDLLYPDNPAVAATLRANAIHTIEQCANLSAMAIEQVGMGAQRYVNDSQKYLEAANKGMGATQLRRELDERDSKIRSLENMVQEMAAEIKQLRQSTNNISAVEQFQEFLAQQQGRPQYPVNSKLAPSFDAQAAQIASVHPTADIAKSKRKRSRVAS